MPAPFKKSLFIFLIIVLLGLFTVNTANSQGTETTQTPLEKARQDYVFQTTKYNELRDKYLSARDNHKAFNTAASKNEAFLKTRDYLVQIPNVYITYLLLVNERSNNHDWSLTDFNKNAEHQKIQSEVKKLEDLKTEAENLKTLEETETYANKLRTAVETTTLPLAYEILAKTDLAQITELENLFIQNASKVETYSKDKLSQKDNQLFLNWQSEVQKAKDLIRLEVENSKKGLSELKYNDQKFNYDTKKVRSLFSPTTGLLKEILSFI